MKTLLIETHAFKASPKQLTENISEAGNLNTANLVINGDMSVAQRGTSSTSTNLQTVDRWGVSFGGVAATQSQQALTSGSPYEAVFNNFIR